MQEYELDLKCVNADLSSDNQMDPQIDIKMTLL